MFWFKFLNRKTDWMVKILLLLLLLLFPFLWIVFKLHCILCLVKFWPKDSTGSRNLHLCKQRSASSSISTENKNVHSWNACERDSLKVLCWSNGSPFGVYAIGFSWRHELGTLSFSYCCSIAYRFSFGRWSRLSPSYHLLGTFYKRKEREWKRERERKFC